VLDLLGLRNEMPAKNVWEEIVHRILNPKHDVTIGVVGKYIELQDAYKSVYESITHAGIANNCKVNIRRIDAEDVEKKGGLTLLKGLDGILVPGGFGDRGTEGKIAAAKYARENKVPYYGLCLGLQIAVIEFARNVLKLEGANSTEFDPRPAHPVINMMEEQKKVIDPNDYSAKEWRIVPAAAEQQVRQLFGAAAEARPRPTRMRDSVLLRVLSMNDLHGALYPRTTTWSQGRQVGGVATLDAMMDSATAQCRCPTIRLDAGDEMQGTLESSLLYGRSTIQAMNRMKIAAAVIGNHELDWGIDTLRARMAEAKYPWLAANLVDTVRKDSAASR